MKADESGLSTLSSQCGRCDADGHEERRRSASGREVVGQRVHREVVAEGRAGRDRRAGSTGVQGTPHAQAERRAIVERSVDQVKALHDQSRFDGLNVPWC